MRITHKMMVDRVGANLRRTMANISDSQARLSSGKRIGKPSDDPPAVSRALALRRSISETGQYLRSIDAAGGWLSATDTALGLVEEVVVKVRALAVRGASGSWGAGQMAAVGAEVGELLHETLHLANTTYAGDHIFAGGRQSTAPFTPDGDPVTAVNYAGDNGPVVRTIGAGVGMTVNANGPGVFAPVFAAIIGLRDDLMAGDTAAVSTRLSELDGALDILGNARAQVGAKANRIDDVARQLRTSTLDLRSRLSRDEDLDIAEALTTYSTDEAVYRASLSTAARMLMPSLIDYLT